MEVTIQKPLKIIELDESSHIGLHIRKRRLDLKLTLPEAAKLLQVTATAVVDWEQGKKEPRGLNSGNIIRFLGYDPFSFLTQSLGQKIRAYRFLHGLTLQQCGDMFDVSEGTVVDWECDKFLPRRENLEKLKELLKEEK